MNKVKNLGYDRRLIYKHLANNQVSAEFNCVRIFIVFEQNQ